MDTVLNYPLLIDIYAYDTIEVGIKRISSYFQGIDILEKRSTARNVLLKYIKKARAQDDDIKLIYAKTIYNYLSKKQGGLISDKGMNYVNTYVYTPNYSPVPARYNMTWSDHEAGLTMAEAEQINSMFLYIYSSATAGAAVNPSYNCHSFAWHSQLTTNKYWIEDPTPYFTDFSYSMTNSTSAGNRITYTTSVAYDHSGIIYSNSGSTLVVKSKWGYYGVMIHNYNDCPYYSQYTTIRYWH